MKRVSTKTMVSLSVLVALQIILTRFCSINAWNVRIGFGFTALVIAAVLHGPAGAALVGGLGDLIGSLAFPSGTYFPGFTLTQMLMGLSFGLALYHRPMSGENAVSPRHFSDGVGRLRSLRGAGLLPVRMTLAVLFNQLVLSLLLNTLWISVLYGSLFRGLLVSRAMQAAVTAPIQLLVVCILEGVLRRRDLRQVLAA